MPDSLCDLNCDLGEGCAHDAELMPLITSASIACGGHAGDEATMRASVALAVANGVRIGAHPGYEDREHFGRRELALGLPEIRRSVLAQIQRLQAIAASLGARVRYVKPHGALYNIAAREAAVARVIAEAVAEADPALALMGLHGSQLLAAGRACGLAVEAEAFIDRCYAADGSLLPRSQPGAVIEDIDQACAQARLLSEQGCVIAVDGRRLALRPDTLCLHGDGPQAVALARALRVCLAR